MAESTSSSSLKGKGKQADHTQQAPNLSQLPHGLSAALPPSGFAVSSPYFSSSANPQVTAGPLVSVDPSTFAGPSSLTDYNDTAGHPDTEHDVAETTTSKKKSKTPVIKLIAGIQLGVTPFPNHVPPTPRECYHVNNLLTQAHGAIVVPEIPKAPSATVAGCGDVPFILEALIRTVISQNTTMAQANTAITNLFATFNRILTGPYTGTLDWNQVRKADPELLTKAIRPAGNQIKKSAFIRGILQGVWEENEEMRRQLAIYNSKNKLLVKMEKSHKRSRSEVERSIAMARLGQNTLLHTPDILTLDYLHEWDTADAFERLNEFDGVGVKTAACILLFCMKRPVFAVDTHVWRFCRWLGWVPTSTTTANNTFAHCDVRVPDELKYSLHQLMIIHGRECRRCNAKNISNDDDPPCVLEPLLLRKKGKDEKVMTVRVEEHEYDDDDKTEPETSGSASKIVPLKRRRPSTESTDTETLIVRGPSANVVQDEDDSSSSDIEIIEVLAKNPGNVDEDDKVSSPLSAAPEEADGDEYMEEADEEDNGSSWQTETESGSEYQDHSSSDESDINPNELD